MRARHVLLAVEVVGLVPRRGELFPRVGDHLPHIPLFEALDFLFEARALLQAQRMHGDVVGRESDGRIDAAAKFFKALPREARDEVAVGDKAEGAGKFERLPHLFRRVLPADRFERAVGKRLRVDADARDAIFLAEGELLFGEHVGAPRLHRVFAAVGAERLHRFQHGAKLLRLQGKGGAAADIDGAKVLPQPLGALEFALHGVEIGGDVLPRLVDGRGDEGAIDAARRAEGQRDVEIAVALLAFVDALLRLDDAGDEFDVVLPDVHLVKERQEIAPLFELPAREAGGTDARQRAPGKMPREVRGEGIV